jgi:hypothetical protein
MPILIFVSIFTLNISFLLPTCLNTDKLTLGPAIRLVFSEEKTHVLRLPTCLDIDNLTLGPAIRLLLSEEKKHVLCWGAKPGKIEATYTSIEEAAAWLLA